MTIQDWLQHAVSCLENTSSTPKLDAELLLSDMLGADRSWLFAHGEHELTKRQAKILTIQLEKRCRHIPIAYIRGWVEFYRKRFVVNKHVLVPRPESEALISCFLTCIRSISQPIRVLDIGTGSGALAITAKLLAPEVEMHATDISKNALRTARENAVSHSVDVNFRYQNLLRGDSNVYGVILANLPYVPISKGHPSIENEPHRALFSGKDGLNHYRRLFQQLSVSPSECVLIESLTDQHTSLKLIAEANGYKLKDVVDLIQVYTRM